MKIALNSLIDDTSTLQAITWTNVEQGPQRHQENLLHCFSVILHG